MMGVGLDAHGAIWLDDVSSSSSAVALPRFPAFTLNKPIICEGVTAPYPAWTVGEAARRDASAPFTSAVVTGNQRRLPKESLEPWAAFFNATHARLHPVFTDTYLASLCALDPRDALNDPALGVKLEFSRDETRGCSTLRTHPFNLGGSPVSKE